MAAQQVATTELDEQVLAARIDLADARPGQRGVGPPAHLAGDQPAPAQLGAQVARQLEHGIALGHQANASAARPR